jgi:hypothetical protein
MPTAPLREPHGPEGHHDWGLPSGRRIQLNSDVDVVLSLSGLGQRCTRRFLPPQQCNLVATNFECKPNPSAKQGHSDRLIGLAVRESTRIQTQASGTKLVNLLHRLGIANNSPQRLTDVVGLQPSYGANRVVSEVMQLGDIPNAFTSRHFKNLVASIRKCLQGAVNFWSHLYRDCQLTTYRYSLAYAVNLTHPDFDQHTYKEAGFPPDTEFQCGSPARKCDEVWNDRSDE